MKKAIDKGSSFAVSCTRVASRKNLMVQERGLPVTREGSQPRLAGLWGITSRRPQRQPAALPRGPLVSVRGAAANQRIRHCAVGSLGGGGSGAAPSTLIGMRLRPFIFIVVYLLHQFISDM